MTILMRRFGGQFDDATWRTVVRRLHRNVMAPTTRDDASFWWGERALNGLLASAFHRGGHWSVVEPLARGHQPRQMRRPDMWFGFGGMREGWFTLEAKISWPRQVKPATVSARLDHAEQQLRNLGDDFRSGVPMAGCWVVPRSRREQMRRPDGDAFVKKHAAALWKHLGEAGEQQNALIAAMSPEMPVHNNGAELYPGVILCLWNRGGLWVGG
jgi:hypothetical protein